MMNLRNRLRPTIAPLALAASLFALPVGALTLQAASRADGSNGTRNAAGCAHATADCAKGMPGCKAMTEECQKRMPGCEKMASGRQMKANCPMMSASASQRGASDARTGSNSGTKGAEGTNPGHCMK